MIYSAIEFCSVGFYLWRIGGIMKKDEQDLNEYQVIFCLSTLFGVGIAFIVIFFLYHES